MAVDLVIRASGIFAKHELDLQALLRNTKLNFGSYTPFFVLNELNDGEIGLLYNPVRMGRGIYFDGSKMHEGEVKMSFNLPSTPTEISDFIRIVSEIKLQYRSIELFSENVTMSMDEFVDGRENYLAYSLSTLRGFCQTKEYESAIITLAAFPYTLTPDEMEFFSEKGTLEDFEKLLHKKQTTDAYYISPKIMHNEETKEIVAFYTLVENCPSILPVEHTCFLNLEQIVVDQGLIRFYLESERKVMDGYFKYSDFITVVLDWGATYFDGDHIYLPGLGAEELREVANAIGALPPPDPNAFDFELPIENL